MLERNEEDAAAAEHGVWERSAPRAPESHEQALLAPHWLLAELSYRCPLRCWHCSNPVELGRVEEELETDVWLDLLRQARAMGAVQLGLSGGEPLVRPDLETIIARARELGFYTNLITSGIGLTTRRLQALKEAGLDHIQLSIQGATSEVSDRIAGAKSFERKVRVAKWIKAAGFPMVLNVVLHRHNIDSTREILELAAAMAADFVELANTQYYGWALTNRALLMPTRAQIERSAAICEEFRGQTSMRILYVMPDYFTGEVKPCMNGWGRSAVVVAPDGTLLPCHAARVIPGLKFPNIRTTTLKEAWKDSRAFSAYRGDGWMTEPCRSCPNKKTDFGGCRCQAFLLTGDARNTDPACSLSPNHAVIATARQEGADRLAASEDTIPNEAALTYRRQPRARVLNPFETLN